MQGQFTFASELPSIVPSDVHLVQSMHYFGAPFGIVPLTRKIQTIPQPQTKAEEKKSKVSQRRAEQNRQAQKSFRERKVKYVQELEEKLQEATKQSMEADLLRIENTELRQLVSSLQTENVKLKQKVSRVHDFNFIPEVKEEFLPKQNPSCESNNKMDNTDTCSSSISDSHELYSSPDNNTSSTPVMSPPSSNVTSPPSNIASPLNMRTPSYDNPESQIINEILGLENEEEKSLDSLSSSFLEQDVQLPTSAEEWSLFIETDTDTEVHKRGLDEANLYLSTFLKPTPFVLSKNEHALKDHEQDELCDMFKKVQCKDKNPELCQGTKYMKSGSD